MKKCILVLLTTLILTLSLASCAQSEPKYEYNTDIRTDKNAGMLSTIVDCEQYDIAGLIFNADAVIIGEAVDNGVAYRETFMESEIALTKTAVSVNKVLVGDVAKDEISFAQVGNPMDNTMTIKLKQGEKVVLFLVYDDEHDYYAGVGFEQAIFYVTDNGLFTNSNNPELGKYDYTSLDLLLRDINNLLK